MNLEEPKIKENNEPMTGFISKVAFAAGYKYKTLGGFRKHLNSLSIKVSRANSYSPKEVKEIISTIGDPEWYLVRTYHTPKIDKK